MAGSVLVCGVGVAGATAAHWLERAGWNVTLVEQSVQPRSSGNPVDVRGPAVDIARRMGIWPDLVAASTKVERVEFVDPSGRVGSTMPTRRPADEEVEVPRADLARALFGAVDGAELINGDTIVALEQDRSGVDVTFAVAAPRRFDLVVGADGLHSVVRRLVLGAEERFIRSFGMVVATVPATVEVDPAVVRILNLPGRSLSVHPGAGEPCAAFIFRSRARIDRRREDASRQVVADTYAADGWLTPALIAQFRAARDVYLDTVARVDLPRWSVGRVVLVGDAANCLSLLGNGSTNAIIGAHTLAEALADHADPQVAFARYEHQHRRQVRSAIRGAGLASHLLVPATAAGIAVRTAVLKVADRFG